MWQSMEIEKNTKEEKEKACEKVWLHKVLDELLNDMKIIKEPGIL